MRNLMLWLNLTVNGECVSDNFVSFSKPKHLELVESDIGLEIRSVDDKILVILSSEIPALWVWLELDGIEAKYSDNFFHLRRDHPVKVEITPRTLISLEEIKKLLKIRSLVDTYKRGELV